MIISHGSLYHENKLFSSSKYYSMLTDQMNEFITIPQQHSWIQIMKNRTVMNTLLPDVNEDVDVQYTLVIMMSDILIYCLLRCLSSIPGTIYKV